MLQTDPPAWRVVDLAVRAETYGFDYVWTFDSHVLWQEPFVIYSPILERTRTVKVGPMVTNPGHPGLDRHRLRVRHAQRHVRRPHRVRHRAGRLGHAGARLPAVRPGHGARGDRVIQGLAEGRTVTYNGTQQQFPWSQGRALPV